MFDAITATQFAMEVDQLKLQSISQNVANMNTPGFKKQLVENNGFDEQLQTQMNNVVQQLQRSQIKTQGTFNQTHNPDDLALAGEGYFQVQSEQGIFYTRRGDFQVNNQGELATATGETLLGKSGVVKIDDNAFTIDEQGHSLLTITKWINSILSNLINPTNCAMLEMDSIKPMNLPIPATAIPEYCKDLSSNPMLNPLMK